MIAQAAQHLMDRVWDEATDLSLFRSLWVSERAAPDASWACCTPDEAVNQPWAQRFDLAVLYPDAAKPAATLKPLLARLRDLHARQLLAFIPVTDSDWQAADGLALGLQRQARFEDEHGVLREAWSYDIRTYKSVPDWLNPRFWANPEQWDRARW